ncbi:MAG: cyclopropane-fatty-acyl-phospholipid synthase family protein [Sphingomicrobium sp.]
MIERLAGKLIRQGRLTLLMPGRDPMTFGPGGGETLTVRLHDRRVAFDIARNPRLGLGEAYMDGRLTIEDGTMLDLLRLVTGSNRWEDRGGARKLFGKSRLSKLKALLRRNTLVSSRRNVAHHYDLRDELYDIFLDDYRQYTAAYFLDPANSLEQAQRDKMSHIAAKLYLQPGQQVLDIGCGWGGMAIYLHRIAGVDVLGITLSEEQLKVARRRAEEAGVSDHVRFELVDYRKVEGTFDRITVVGMIEHVGAVHYDEFFARCRDLLKPDGVMLLHTIGRLGAASLGPDPFTDKYIFPGYHVPSLNQLTAASEKARLIVSDVEILRLHYVYTLEEWLRRFTAACSRVVEMYDERFYRMWEFYLAAGVVMFETGTGCNYQVQYIRDRRAVPITRDYMAEAEARYRAMSTF